MPALVLLQAIFVLLALAPLRGALHHAAAAVALFAAPLCAAWRCLLALADQAVCLVSAGVLAAPLQELLRRQRGPGVPGVSCA